MDRYPLQSSYRIRKYFNNLYNCCRPGAAPDCLLKRIVSELLGESVGWWLAENEAIEAPADKL